MIRDKQKNYINKNKMYKVIKYYKFNIFTDDDIHL